MADQRDEPDTDQPDSNEARARLRSEHERVEGLIHEVRRELEEGDDEHHGELSGYDQHPADSGSATFEREKDLAVLESLEHELAELEAALARIDEGTYGIDEVTGQPIDPARLEARPAARTNVENA